MMHVPLQTMRVDSLIAAVIALLGQGSDSSVEAGLTLGTTLLAKGHKAIQDKFLEQMSKPKAHGMMQQLLSRIEIAREEVKELRIIVFQLLSDFEPSALEHPRSLQDIFHQGAMKEGADLSGRSCIGLVLVLLQGLCKGLPNSMQRLLGGREHKVNLVTALALNVCELDRTGSVHPINIVNTIQYIKSLALLVQVISPSFVCVRVCVCGRACMCAGVFSSTSTSI
jgi:hypothetical protein